MPLLLVIMQKLKFKQDQRALLFLLNLIINQRIESGNVQF